jgi:hypothetical protein
MAINLFDFLRRKKNKLNNKLSRTNARSIGYILSSLYNIIFSLYLLNCSSYCDNNLKKKAIKYFNEF